MQTTKYDEPSRAASLLADLAHGKKVPADAINLLMMDHRQVEDWFAAYPKLEPAAKLRLVQDICTALKAHAMIEEELFYPEVQRATGADDLVEHGLQEHAEAKQMIAELEEMSDADAEMDRTVQELSKAIADHVEEEEQELFPKARESALDLVELGARLTALRLAAFADVTGKARSGLDRHPWNLPDAPVHLVDPDTARRAFVRCLRDAHAMEKQSEIILSKEIGRLDNYPDVEARMNSHLDETHEQLQRLEQILDEMGESRSSLKDATAALAGRLGQLALTANEDEVLKGALASAAFENFEAASYEQLIAMGEMAGQISAIRLLQHSLSEERAMAIWLQEHTPHFVERYLQLAAEDSPPAGR